MSLELAIQENTSALRELIARLTTTSAITMTGAEYIAKLDAPVTDKVEAKKPAATQTAAETKAATTASAAESRSEPSTPAINYTKDVKPLLVKVSTTKGRDALVALLTKFGVAKGDALPVTVLADVLAEIETVLAA